MSSPADIREDKAIKSLKRTVKASRQIDVPVLKAEVKNLHEGRLSRRLGGGNKGANSLYEAAAADIAIRSRMVAILVEAHDMASDLQTAYDSVRGHLMSVYGSSFGVRTKYEKDAHIDRELRFAKKRIENLRVLVKIVEHFTEDIDKSSWAMKRMVEILDLKAKREAL